MTPAALHQLSNAPPGPVQATDVAERHLGAQEWRLGRAGRAVEGAGARCEMNCVGRDQGRRWQDHGACQDLRDRVVQLLVWVPVAQLDVI